MPFAWPVADRDEDFLLSESNRAAFEHLTRWSLWPVMATLVTGPRKSGRSLLGRIFVRKTGGRLFDNAEEHDEEALFHAWNEAQAARRPLLIIADKPPPGWAIKLARPALPPRGDAAAGDRRRPTMFCSANWSLKLLGDRGIAAPPELADYLVPRIERSYVSVHHGRRHPRPGDALASPPDDRPAGEARAGGSGTHPPRAGRTG